MERKKRKPAAGLCLLAVLLCLALTGCGTGYVLTTGFGSDEIFRIDKASCTTKEYLVYLTNIENQYSKAFGEEIWEQSVNGKSVEEDVSQTVLARLVKIKMMNLLAAQQEISLSEEEQQAAEDAAEAYYASLSEEELAAFDKISKGDLQDMYEEYALAQKVYRYYTDDISLEISDDEARTVELKQICIPFSGETDRQDAKSRMELALAKLSGGDSFDVVAAEYNEADEMTLSVSKGQTEQAVEDAVFNLSAGETSGIIEAADAYYIFYCSSAYDAQQVDAEKEKRIAEYKQTSFDSVYNMFAAEKECFLNHDVWDELESVRSGQVQTSDFFEVYETYFSELG